MDVTIPDAINPDKQKLSVKTMRASLLKNLIPINDKNVPPGKEGSEKKLQVYTEINEFLEDRVDKFLKIILSFSDTDDFNPNKLSWYFEIYKEGTELKNSKPFSHFSQFDDLLILSSIDDLSKMSVKEMCNLGPNALSDIFANLSAWYREKLLNYRKKEVYVKNDPLQWFKAAEENDEAFMKTMNGNAEGLKDICDPRVVSILDLIQLLRGRKI